MVKLRNVVIGGAVAAVGGAAAYYLRERNSEQPDHRLVRLDKQFELRDYPELLVATTEHIGTREKALNRGFDRLAAYIFAKDRPADGEGDAPGRTSEGEGIAMTAPVLQDADKASGGWRTRFIMPSRYTRESLPQPPADIRIESLPARRVAAVRFSGSPNTNALRKREDELRRWLERERLQPIGAFEYAFYNSPMIPPFMRRNEVLVPVSGD